MENSSIIEKSNRRSCKLKQLAYYDGAFLPLDTYAVHLEDRGFQFGDGVFETIRVYAGKCFALKEHLERYRRSMRELSIPITDSDEELVGVFGELIEKTEIREGIIYFQLTRGTSPRAYLPPKINLPHLSVVIRDVPIHTDWQENGIELYNILDRVSCWCCCNKNQKELYNIWKHMPEYWQKLTDLQHRTNRPMKKFRTDPEFGNLGNILNLEKYWAKQQTIKNEYEQQNLFT